MSTTLTGERLEQIREQARRAAAEAPPLPEHIKHQIAVLLAPRNGGGAR